MPVHDYMISLQPHHADRIRADEKTVEFRRRAPAIPNGSRLWVYSKRPRGCVEAVAEVTGLFRDRPERLWQYYSKLSGVSEAEFQQYFAGAHHGCAIIFSNVRPILPPITLPELRALHDGFHPPRSVVRLRVDDPALVLFRGRAGSTGVRVWANHVCD
jgi:predicted transcriptional regulator